MSKICERKAPILRVRSRRRIRRDRGLSCAPLNLQTTSACLRTLSFDSIQASHKLQSSCAAFNFSKVNANQHTVVQCMWCGGSVKGQQVLAPPARQGCFCCHLLRFFGGLWLKQVRAPAGANETRPTAGVSVGTSVQRLLQPHANVMHPAPPQESPGMRDNAVSGGEGWQPHSAFLFGTGQSGTLGACSSRMPTARSKP